ncbi:MAG: uridine diphosphate-N-acetylglucosamine-binding protein YvcK [Clostridia bacterium]|nr:uridine diphosphate-N-acetylglucosamine-binding protein YvcK [Clostridia bacterium]
MTYSVLLIILGIVLIALSVINANRSLLSILGIHDFSELFKYRVHEKYHLEKACKIVVIGGGTGLSVILRGLKKATSNITAVVTTTDDGGGSGVLREDLGMLPPGDIRSCILALADTEEYMQELLQYRFKEGYLTGQSFGNLLIAALTGIYDNFEEAVAKVHEFLAVKGRVIPVTAENIHLCAQLKNGTIVKGESKIIASVIEQSSPIEKVYLEPHSPEPIDDALTAIKEADVIILGPGSLFTSIIPNLLVKKIVDKVTKSDAIKIYMTNVMTQPGETDRYSVCDHIEGIENHIEKNIIDYVMVNSEGIPKELLHRYKEDGAEPVFLTKKERRKLKRRGIKIIEGPYIEIKQGYIRHDADKIADVVINLYKRG